MLIAYFDDHYLEIVFQPNNSVSLIHEQKGSELLERNGLNDGSARIQIRKIAAQIWNIPASSTQSTTTFTAKNLRALRSKIAREEVSPLFTTNASPTLGRIFATT